MSKDKLIHTDLGISTFLEHGSELVFNDEGISTVEEGITKSFGLDKAGNSISIYTETLPDGSKVETSYFFDGDPYVGRDTDFCYSYASVISNEGDSCDQITVGALRGSDIDLYVGSNEGAIRIVNTGKKEKHDNAK